MKGGMMKQEIKLTPKDDYAAELPTLWYDRQYVLDHMEGIDTDSWLSLIHISEPTRPY